MHLENLKTPNPMHLCEADDDGRPADEAPDDGMGQELGDPAQPEQADERVHDRHHEAELDGRSVVLVLAGHLVSVRVQGFRVQGSGFRVWGSPGMVRVQGPGFRVQGAGFRVQGSRFREYLVGVQGSGSGVQGSGYRVQGSGYRVQGSRFTW